MRHVDLSTALSNVGNKWKWTKILGYTPSKLRKHIEKQFLPGMTWKNRSLWHIDHILPVSKFNFEKPEDEDFKRCWALSNLRPMWAKDNFKKHDKVDKPFQTGIIFNKQPEDTRSDDCEDLYIRKFDSKIKTALKHMAIDERCKTGKFVCVGDLINRALKAYVKTVKQEK